MATKSNASTVTTHNIGWLAPIIHVSLGKSGHSVGITTERLNNDMLAHVFTYGLKQMLNDAAASGQNVDEKVGLFNKKLEAMYEGTLRAARESDPIAKEARRIATDFVTRKTEHKAGSDAFKAAVAKAASDPKVLHLATANVERAKGLDLDIDI